MFPFKKQQPEKIAANEWLAEKTIIAGQKLHNTERLYRIGNAMPSDYVFQDYIIHRIIMEKEISIQLNNDLVVKAYDPSSHAEIVNVNRNMDILGGRYIVVFKGKVIFQFIAATDFDSSIALYKIGNLREYFQPKINMFRFWLNDGLDITSTDMMQFDDADISYMLNSFPYRFKLIKYVMQLFITELKKIFNFGSFSERERKITNTTASYFIDNPIDKHDEEMRNILQDIYASNINRHFTYSR